MAVFVLNYQKNVSINSLYVYNRSGKWALIDPEFLFLFHENPVPQTCFITIPNIIFFPKHIRAQILTNLAYRWVMYLTFYFA